MSIITLSELNLESLYTLALTAAARGGPGHRMRPETWLFAEGRAHKPAPGRPEALPDAIVLCGDARVVARPAQMPGVDLR